MDLREMLLEVLRIVSEFLEKITNPVLLWRWFRKTFKKEVWNKFIRPVIKSGNLDWVPQAKRIVALLYLVVLGFFDLPERAQVESDPKETLRQIVKAMR